MSEGFLHGVLVSRLAQDVRLRFGSDLDLLLVDLPGTRPTDKPPRIGRFVPDVWAQTKRRIVVGEAKTATDLETAHTRAQLRGFMEHVALSPAGSLLLLAVPIFMTPFARGLLADIAIPLSVDPALWSVIGAEAFEP